MLKSIQVILTFQKTEATAKFAAVHRCTTVQKIKFSIKDCFTKCDQIRSSLGIWSHLLKIPLMENFIFREVYNVKDVLNISKKI